MIIHLCIDIDTVYIRNRSRMPMANGVLQSSLTFLPLRFSLLAFELHLSQHYFMRVVLGVLLHACIKSP